jgi:hypothetical protein
MMMIMIIIIRVVPPTALPLLLLLLLLLLLRSSDGLNVVKVTEVLEVFHHTYCKELSGSFLQMGANSNLKPAVLGPLD